MVGVGGGGGGGGGGGRYLCLYLQWSGHLYVTPFDERVVGWGFLLM